MKTQNNYDVIRYILRKYASREKPIARKEIEDLATAMDCKVGRTAIRGFMEKELVLTYEREEECDELLRNKKADGRTVIFCKKSANSDRTIGYWMLEAITDSEWIYLMDSVLYSKILTKKEADNLAERITYLVGKDIKDLMGYRCRMYNQPYFIGDKDIDGNVGYIESRVLKQVHLIRKALKEKKRVKFNLCVYDYSNQQVRLVPYGKHGKVMPETPKKYKEDVHRICIPFEIIFSNGRYYMLGADLETVRNVDLKYKLYRVDLMEDVSIIKGESKEVEALIKEQTGIYEKLDLYQYRMENPYMFTGNVETVRLRVDSDQFTQIVDWFGENFKVLGYDANEEDYYDIEVRVNPNSMIFWALQYSGCVEMLDIEKNGNRNKNKESLRDKVRNSLKKALEKYEDKEYTDNL